VIIESAARIFSWSKREFLIYLRLQDVKGARHKRKIPFRNFKMGFAPRVVLLNLMEQENLQPSG